MKLNEFIDLMRENLYPEKLDDLVNDLLDDFNSYIKNDLDDVDVDEYGEDEAIQTITDAIGEYVDGDKMWSKKVDQLDRDDIENLFIAVAEMFLY